MRKSVRLAAGCFLLLVSLCATFGLAADPAPATRSAAAPLPGTQPLDAAAGDLTSQMLDGIDRFLDRHTASAVERRAALWKRDNSSPQKYEESIAPNRAHLAALLGMVDKRVPFDAPELIATTDHPALVGKGVGYEIYNVRWPAMAGVWSEGLLLAPIGDILADVVAIPDADQTPEMICGLVQGIPPESQFPVALARAGCRVLVPTLINRDDTFSVAASGRATNQTHREWIYRPAFEMGRTISGYEIQKVLAAVDWFEKDSKGKNRKIGVFGYGEGGLLALYAGALDTRIASVAVSGYFDSRQNLCQEPIYRNVMGLLREFGDAEIATLIAPRALTIEAGEGPEIPGPPAATAQRRGAAPGALKTPEFRSVLAEVTRADLTGAWPGKGHGPAVAVPANAGAGFGDAGALQAFLYPLGGELRGSVIRAPALVGNLPDPQARQARLVGQMSGFTQRLVDESPYVRSAFWAKADRKSHSPAKWKESVESYRKDFEETISGRFDDAMLAPNVRSRQIFDEPAYVGYEVLMDVWPDVTASGILLVPRGIKPGERRPVVVCQHGLDGHARDVADPKFDSPFYHRFACRLAEQGFVTFAPQNPYTGGNRFRQLIRKANPLGATLWTFIVAQHRQSTDWLATLPFVDPDRIAFYGLSYGGKTAMRVPAVVGRYCLSICSGDFNEWIWKCTSLRYPNAYPATIEYEMFEWNLGNTFNYAEMAGLIAPRPFMVERGHRDGVGIDEWVAYEYAKVKYLYDDLGIGDRTAIEYFDGPHMINGVGTFKFLHEQLKWPKE